MTDFYVQCTILGELYASYEEDFKDFSDFVKFNDLGFPIAYLNAHGLALPSVDGVRFVEQTWDLFLAELNIEDTGFETLEEVFEASNEVD
jgi:hypothetical protein